MTNTTKTLLFITLSLVILGCSYNPGGDFAAGQPSITIKLAGFSTLEPVIKDMVGDWNTWRGLNGYSSVAVQTEFGPSSRITAALVNNSSKGTPIAILGSDGDRKKLERAGLAGDSNRKLAKFGVVATTPLVIVTRKGNPANLHEFVDLARPGIKLLMPDPQQSSLAQWSIIAFYESVRRQNAGDNDIARTALSALRHNVIKQPLSAKIALQAFKDGDGDALIAYEADVLELLNTASESDLTVIIPSTTMMCEFVICLMDRIYDEQQSQAATDLAAYMFNAAGQKVWARHFFNSPYFPSLNPPTRYAGIKTMMQIDDLGGFEQAYKDIVEGIWVNL